MKTKQEIKNELHRLIDNIDDVHTLAVLNEDIIPLTIEARTQEEDEDEIVTPIQEAELSEAIRQANSGETVSWEDFLKATSRWHIK